MTPFVMPDVPGWLDPGEAEELAKHARGKIVLEFGAWQGRSTVVMGLVAAAVVTIDHHLGDSGATATSPNSLMTNLHRHGVIDRVVAITADIERAAPLLPRNLFDLVFIDAEHKEESVSRDIRLALPLLKEGGTLAFHDANYPGVQEAIRKAGLTGGYVVQRTYFVRVGG